MRWELHLASRCQVTRTNTLDRDQAAHPYGHAGPANNEVAEYDAGLMIGELHKASFRFEGPLPNLPANWLERSFANARASSHFASAHIPDDGDRLSGPERTR